MMVSNSGDKRRLDHTLGLNFRRIPLSDELGIQRPSAEQVAELRLQRLQEREAEREHLMERLTTFKSSGLWSRCRDRGPEAGGFIRKECSCHHQVALGKEVLAVDASRLSDLLAHRRHGLFCRRTMFHYEDPQPSEIFSHPALNGAIRSAAQEHLSDDTADIDRFAAAYDRALRRVASLLFEMRAKMNRYVIQATGWLFGWILPKFFARLIVSEREMAMLKEIQSENVPIVYLPLHRSHLDYVLLPYVLWYHNLPLPYVAAGDNLKVPLLSLSFSFLLRRFGGFFIRRKITSGNGESDDNIYRALLQTYIERLLARGQSLEFYVEAGRSRTGRTRCPKTGLLSMVDSACVRGPVRDVYLVPLAIGYERPPDVDFAEERLGNQKPRESFLSILRSMWNFCHTSYGFVRFSIGRPVRLSHFRASMALRHCDDSGVGAAAPSPSDGLPAGELCTLLARHSLFFATRQHPVMATHLLAFVLLTQHRRGASLTDVAASVATTHSLLRHDLLFGFHNASSPSDIVTWAANLLAPLLDLRRGADGSLEWLAPRLTLPEALNLSYFAQAMLPALGLDAVKACAFVRVRGAAAPPDLGLPGRLFDEAPTPAAPADLCAETVESLARVLGQELLLRPPCVRPEVIAAPDSHLWRVLCRGTEPGYLDRRGREATGVGREDEVRIDLGAAETVTTVRWLCVALGPVLEAYWATCWTVYEMQAEEVWTEAECVRRTMRGMKKRMERSLLVFVESQCSETVRNCLKSLEDCKIIERSHVNSTIVSMSLLDSERLLEVMELLESCLVRP